jgi:hypothetical protein
MFLRKPSGKCRSVRDDIGSEEIIEMTVNAPQQERDE